MPEQDAATGVPGSLTDAELQLLDDFWLRESPRAAKEIRRLRAQVAGHAERIAAQSAILSKRAEGTYADKRGTFAEPDIAKAVAEERRMIAARIKDYCAPPLGDKLAALVEAGGGWGCRIDPAAEERERCAQVAEALVRTVPYSSAAYDMECGEAEAARQIAAAIRNLQ